MKANCRSRQARNPRTRAYIHRPAANIRKSESEVTLELALPGWSRDEIDLKVENRSLLISGKATDNDKGEFQYTRRAFGKTNFERSFQLGNRLDIDSINARMDSGVLMVTIPVMAKETTKITIQ